MTTSAVAGSYTTPRDTTFALFRESLRLEHGLPSHDTFSRLFRLIDPEALSAAFGSFLDALAADGRGVVAIDGKTLSRPFDRAAGTSALHAVTAFATDTKRVIGQKAVAAGSNEIVAGRALLDLLSLEGTLVTADAIHCQSETAATVLARGGDDLFALKGNRPALHADVMAFFADPPADSLIWHETSDADHGRIELRRHAVTPRVDWLFSHRRYAGEPHMPGLASLAMVASTVDRDGKTAPATRSSLSSARLTPERFERTVRAHWTIENTLHWGLDTAFDEDRAGTRQDHGAHNLATLRKLALNRLQTARPDLSIRRKRNRAGWSDAFARSIIAHRR